LEDGKVYIDEYCDLPKEGGRGCFIAFKNIELLSDSNAMRKLILW
jgi:hypothetical protein